jgi:O-acetyl-ADP-ribose deacetylase (regulator of RNase III)
MNLPLPLRVVFVSQGGEYKDAVQKRLGRATREGMLANVLDIDYFVGDIRDVKRRKCGSTFFVSPGNSMGFMDGGIDLVYSRCMFPGIERKLRSIIRRVSPYRTAGGEAYLPIGSAIAVVIDDDLDLQRGNNVIVAAPTMFRPNDVSNTRNAYHAFRAALDCIDVFYRKHSSSGIDHVTIVCPALCCGYGRMSYDESAPSIERFRRDHTRRRRISHYRR